MYNTSIHVHVKLESGKASYVSVLECICVCLCESVCMHTNKNVCIHSYINIACNHSFSIALWCFLFWTGSMCALYETHIPTLHAQSESMCVQMFIHTKIYALVYTQSSKRLHNTECHATLSQSPAASAHVQPCVHVRTQSKTLI